MTARWGTTGLAGAFFALAVAGCIGGSGEGAPSGDVGTTDDAVSDEMPSFVTIRRDFRKCLAPTCGGYFVRDVNRSDPEVYVSDLDLAALDDREAADVRESAPQDLVLRAHLGPADPSYHTRKLVVIEAYRGLPGVETTAGAYYQVTTAAGGSGCRGKRPCALLTRRARRIGTSNAESIARVDVSDAAGSFVDEAWLASRVMSHRAIVLGAIEADTAGIRALRARQIFLRLPELPGPCPQYRLSACPDGQEHAYRRDTDRCLVFTGCVAKGLCPHSIPACGEGYTLVSWPSAPDACSAFACDPAFTRDD